jgi:hypothetical protein
MPLLNPQLIAWLLIVAALEGPFVKAPMSNVPEKSKAGL